MHAMLGKRFIERENRTFGPAWHKITDPITEEISAVAALDRMGDEIRVTAEPIMVPSWPGMEIPERLLVRHPVADDPVARSFGVAGPEFEVIDRREICRLWDEHLALPVETMGDIYEGRCQFLTGDLGRIQVVDETLHRFLCVNSWFDASGAIKMFDVDVREVCANTVRAAEAAAGASMYRVIHDRNARSRVNSWMHGMAGRIYGVGESLTQAFELLARTQVTDDAGFAVLEAAYPDPKQPALNAPDDVMEGRFKQYEADKQTALDRRMTAADLFEGEGTGMRTQAAFGSLWGLYNAVVELEDYRRGGSDKVAAISAFLGSRAETKQRAFEAAISAARN